MTELRALFYADRCAFVNDLKSAWRSRGRLVLWLVYGFGIVAFVWSRTLPLGRHGHVDAHADLVRADYFICAQVLLFAVSLAFGSGRIGLFRTLAEARFVIGSTVRAPVAIAYLQARDSLTSALRSLSQVAFIGFGAAPRHLTPFVAVAGIVFFGAMFGATRTVLLARNLAPRPWPAICIAAGVPLALAAIEPAVRDLAGWLSPFQPLAARVVDVLPAVHPGTILLAPTPLGLVVPLGILAATIAFVARGGRDAYPELYALSLARIDNAAYLAERRNRKRDGVSRKTVAVALPAPSGSLVIVWKSVVEFRRAHPTLWSFLLGAAVWIAAGYAFARVSAALEPLAVVSSSATVTVFVMSTFGPIGLAAELRRPLFWVCGISLFERLGALVVARNWRLIFSLELVSAGLVAGGAGPVYVLLSAVVFPALVVFMGCVALAVYALVPSVNPRGGASVPLRLFGSFALLTPVIATAAFGTIVGTPLDVSLVVALLFSEAVALTGFAAWRIGGRIDRLVS
jgi:hypothetical protein